MGGVPKKNCGGVASTFVDLHATPPYTLGPRTGLADHLQGVPGNPPYPEDMGIFHGRGVRQGEGERPYARNQLLPASSGERRVGARPFHGTLKDARSGFLVPSAEFATPRLRMLVRDGPECLKVEVLGSGEVQQGGGSR